MKSIVKEINNRFPAYLLIAILVIAFLIRLFHGLSYGFSNDELSALARLQFDNINDLLYKGIAIDAHPPLVQFLLYYWIKLFGSSLLSVRLPFILAGTASVWVVYKAGQSWFNYTSGLIAAAIIAFSGYTILYSEIARPYSFGLLFSSLTLYYWGRIFIKKETSLRNFIWMSIWVLLSMYTHYYSFFVSGLMFASALFFLNKSTYKKYIYASLLIVVFYLPYVPIFIQQLGYGGVGGSDGWLGKPSADWLWNYLSYVNNDSFLLIFVSIIGFVISVISLLKNKFYIPLILPVWFLISFLFGYVYSIHVNAILQYSILIFCFPCLVIFIAYGLSKLNLVLNPLFSTVLIALVVFATTDKSGFFKLQHFGSFDLPANNFVDWSANFPRSKTFSIIDVNHAFYINYYLDSKGSKPNIYQMERLGSRQLFIDALSNPDIEYMIYGWSTKQPNSEIYTAIQYAFPYIIEERIYFNSRMSLYSRTNPDKLETYSEVIVLERAESIPEKKQLFTPNKEYGANVEFQDINLPDSIPLIIEAMVFVSSIDSLKGMLVIDAILGNGEKLWKAKNLSLYRASDSAYFAFTSLSIPGNSKKIKKLKVYIWNNKKEAFNVTDVSVKIKENKEGYVFLPHYY
jgi:uncharacterized membrane protein